MNTYDKNYANLLDKILTQGVKKSDRTGVGTISLFGEIFEVDMKEGFPLLTTKKIHHKSVVYELLWFLKGGTNIKYLVENGVSIWNEWPHQRYEKYRASLVKRIENFDPVLEKTSLTKEHFINLLNAHPALTLKEFAEKVNSDELFAAEWGELGPVYGSQWVNWDQTGINQITDAINLLKKEPDSRRNLVTAWNPTDLSRMLLPPCHYGFQFWTNPVESGRELSLMFQMRSVDMFLGFPFDIASYGLLLHMVAQVVGMSVGKLKICTGDTHIYLNHVEQVKELLQREPKKLPQLELDPNVKDIFQFDYQHIQFKDYDAWPAIKAQVAV
jgi:thymidylate synthase